MSELVRLELADGKEVWARVENVDGASDVAWRDGPLTARMNDLRATVDAVATTVEEALRAAKPDQVTVEFGVELAAKSGKVVSVLAEASAKASLKISLSWSTSVDRVVGSSKPESEPDEVAVPEDAHD